MLSWLYLLLVKAGLSPVIKLLLLIVSLAWWTLVGEFRLELALVGEVALKPHYPELPAAIGLSIVLLCCP